MPKEILLTHAQKYPLMQPADAVKLLYQRQFGGGHMIRNGAACMEFLLREYEATAQTDSPLLEAIGNGMVRVMLTALDANGYSPQLLGQDFIRSANSLKGSPEAFRDALRTLSELTRQGQMPFSCRELEDYLTDYETAGFPAVSHSEVYRCAYSPAYRVLHSDHLPQQFRKQVP